MQRALDLRSAWNRTVCHGAAALLACLAAEAMHAQSPPLRRDARGLSATRVTSDIQRPRLEDRARRHGFETAAGPIRIVASTGPEDARLAASLAQASWQETASLVEHFAPHGGRPAVAPGAVQIDISNQSGFAGDRSPVIVVGSQTRILVSAGGGSPPLAEQETAVRAAAAQAYLHLAELDRQLPAWVCQGLAKYVGQSGEKKGESSATAPEVTSGPMLRPARFSRKAASEAIAAAPGGADAAELVRFLIEGNDAAHAPAFFAALRDHVGLAGKARIDRGRQAQGTESPAPPAAHLEELVSALAQEFAAWQEEPQLGQPIWEPEANAEEEQVETQRSMVFILKLVHRFGAEQPAPVKVRITTFDKEQGRAVVTMREGGPAATSLPALFVGLTDEARPAWATLDPAGKLLMHTEGDRLREIMELENGRFELVQRKAGWELRTKLEDGRQWTAWLEPNDKQPSRLIVKFAFAPREQAAPRQQTPRRQAN